ncbi:MAG: NADP-dependent oxidoreductase [Chloroflexota bacterium]|nr:NADP-dependent oxidoreductase [Chloroflexota bacterium]
MRAVALSEFGGPEVLTVADLPVPEPGDGEVRIRVAAATVNPTDLGYRSGRQAQLLSALPPPYVPGMEMAGTVDAAGAGTGWQTGERVMAIVLPSRTGRGAQSELVVVPKESVARVPQGVSLEQAATLPMNGLTARRALDLLGLAKGQTLAVTGAAGAVGGYVTQLGVQDGLRVLAVARPRDEAVVKELGATLFVPAGDGAAQGIRRLVPEGVDGLVDAAVIGAPILPAVRDGGQIASVRPFNGEPERDITIKLTLVSDYARNTAALERLGDLVAEGKLTLRLAETFPPERAAEAHRKFEAGGVRGRLVIVF